jgi:hypothetical protein
MDVPSASPTLNIKVTQTGVTEATAGVNRLADASTNLSKAQQQLITMMQQAKAEVASGTITNSVSANAMQQQLAGIQAAAAATGNLGLVEKDLIATNAALAASSAAVTGGVTAAGVGFNTAGVGIGRLRQGFVSLIAQATGTIPVLDRVGATLGTMAIGSGPIIAVLAAGAALALMWRNMTEDARKAQEEQDKLTKALHEFRLEQDQGPAGKFGEEIDAMIKKLKELNDTLNKTDASGHPPLMVTLKALGAGLFAGLSGDPTAIASGISGYIRNWYAGQLKAVDEGTKDLAAGIKEKNKRVNDAAVAALRDQLEAMTQATKEAVAPVNATTDALTKEVDAIDKVTGKIVANNIALDRQAVSLQLIGPLKEKYDAETVRQQALAAIDLTQGQAYYNARVQEINQVYTLTAAKADETKKHEDANAAIEINNALVADANKVGKQNEDQTRRQTDEWLKAHDAALKYSEAMDRILREGLVKIFEHGLGDWTHFFDTVLQAFTKMLAEMEKKAAASDLTPGGFQYNALGAAGGAIVGGQVGYQVGQQGGGIEGGIIAGGIAGSALGPWGAIAGGLAGAAGALLGAADAHRQAAKALKDAGDSLDQSLLAFDKTGNTTADALASNAATLKKLLDTARANYEEAIDQKDVGAVDRAKDQFDLAQAEAARNVQKISDDFWGGITQQLNALKGPAGDYQNSLLALQKTYEDNLRSAMALGATWAQMQPIIDLYAQSLKKLQDAEQQRIQRAGEDIAVRGLRAQGFGTQADAMAFQLQQTRELQDAIANGMDATTLALLQNTLALEATAFAAQQLAAQMQTSRSDIARDVQGGFTTGAAGLEQERAALGFGGLSNEDIKAMYTIFTGTPLSQSQEDLNNRIVQFLTDAGQWVPAVTAATDSLASAVASDSYQKASIGTVSSISDAQANGVLGRLDVSNSYLSSIDSTLRNWFGSGTSLSQSPTGFRNAGTVNNFSFVLPSGELDAMANASPTFAAALDRANGSGLVRVRAGAGGTRT